MDDDPYGKEEGYDGLGGRDDQDDLAATREDHWAGLAATTEGYSVVVDCSVAADYSVEEDCSVEEAVWEGEHSAEATMEGDVHRPVDTLHNRNQRPRWQRDGWGRCL